MISKSLYQLLYRIRVFTIYWKLTKGFNKYSIFSMQSKTFYLRKTNNTYTTITLSQIIFVPMCLSVFFLCSQMVKSLTAHVTHKWLFSRMNPEMYVQISFHRKRFPTYFALVRPHSGMHAHVNLALIHLSEFLVAHVARERLLTRVLHHVCFEGLQ